MSQDDQSVANSDGATVRADINANLQALASCSSGTSAPGTTWPNQLWFDTTADQWKIRDAANTAWIVLGGLVTTTWTPWFEGAAMGAWSKKNPAVLAKTAAYTVLVADDGKLIDADASGGAFTVTLPTVASAGDGFVIAVKKTDSSSNAVTVDGNGAETIDGAATRSLSTRYQVEFYRCDGTEWHLMSDLSGATGVLMLDRNVAVNEIVNTATETELYNYTIPAGLLSTNKGVRVTIDGDYLNNSGSSETFTVRVKFGSTTMYADATGNLGSGATRYPTKMVLELFNLDATNDQHVGMALLVGTNGSPTTGVGVLTNGLVGSAGGVVSGVAAEDTTGALDLVVTIQHATAAATISFRAHIRLIELLP